MRPKEMRRIAWSPVAKKPPPFSMNCAIASASGASVVFAFAILMAKNSAMS
jgi:hypothetical protein